MTAENGGAPGFRRVLGIDLGERRIGVALGDPRTRVATPFTTLARARDVDGDARTIARLAAEQDAATLVVGLPFDMSGGEGPQAEATRAWAEAIAAATGLTVRFRDERLTSERAERQIGRLPRGRAGGPPTPGQRDAYRGRVDREAAALILQDEFDAMTYGREAPGGEYPLADERRPTARDRQLRDRERGAS